MHSLHDGRLEKPGVRTCRSDHNHLILFEAKLACLKSHEPTSGSSDRRAHIHGLEWLIKVDMSRASSLIDEPRLESK